MCTFLALGFTFSASEKLESRYPPTAIKAIKKLQKLSSAIAFCSSARVCSLRIANTLSLPVRSSAFGTIF